METIASVSPFWLWLALAGLLLIIELMLVPTGFLLIAAGAAACVSGLAFMAPASHMWQGAAFAALTLVSTLVWRRVIRRQEKKGGVEQPGVNERAAQLVGHTAILTEGVFGGRGRLKINDSSWPVEADTDYPAGTMVEVVKVRGITLVVKSMASGGNS